MRILLAIDCSACSAAAVDEVCNRRWPAGSLVKVLAVVHARVPTIVDPFRVTTMIHFDIVEHETEPLRRLVADVASLIREKAVNLAAEGEVLEGSPEKVIVEETQRWGADPIVLRSHGYGPPRRTASSEHQSIPGA